jgi:hypothetical protein
LLYFVQFGVLAPVYATIRVTKKVVSVFVRFRAPKLHSSHTKATEQGQCLFSECSSCSCTAEAWYLVS